MATIKEVADLAGVSITTVSHVINSTRFVKQETRQRVIEAMQRLNYRPNNTARSLRMGISKMLGLMVPDNSNPFFAEMARKIENLCYENGYNVILCNSDNNQEREASYIELLIGKMVDGVIFIASGNQPDHLTKLVEAEIPIVIVDREVNQQVADVILVDNCRGGYLATEYLIQLGHRNLACISGSSKVTPSADRVQGYLQALHDYGLQPDHEKIVSGDLSYEGGMKAMNTLLSLSQPPTGVFCCNDLMAIGAMRAIRSASLRVPEDVSLVGFDDIFIASAVTPALTTIAQPISDIAGKAAELLLERARNPERERSATRIIFQPQLIIRDSCHPVER